ncbi:hypothetical protein JOB18_003041 [Solea senegalensis]|uniref:Uncharacterized protein n=1 Tax=Solea senegalensis TaxID=28829 RepID=A0AAV6QTN1_SOLSE|nr:hypothetical protein JOB18_003041 [Solea senegalensis]
MTHHHHHVSSEAVFLVRVTSTTPEHHQHPGDTINSCVRFINNNNFYSRQKAPTVTAISQIIEPPITGENHQQEPRIQKNSSHHTAVELDQSMSAGRSGRLLSQR